MVNSKDLKEDHEYEIYKSESRIGKYQGEFRPNKDCSYCITTIEKIIKKRLEYGKSIGIKCLDFSKAFDKMYREGIEYGLRMLQLPENLIQFIKELTFHNILSFEINNNKFLIETKRGVKQGEASKILEENGKTLKKNMEPNGIEIGYKDEKKILRCMCYADDTCLIVPNRKAAQLLCKTVEECCKKYGLSLNAGKTQMKTTSTFLDRVKIDRIKLKAQKELKYLEKIISIK
uniref:Reverse transcriptase domain-containing protein n=1 Tax=Strongyloides venezuelensis TaxID=75913 RepID=A0A0K0G4L4_STRVS